MDATNKNQLIKAALSLFIACILVAQVMVIPLKIIGKPVYMWYWPIIDYAMYESSHFEGEYIMSHYDVQVSLIDNSVLKVNNKDLGLKTFPFLYLSRGLSNGSDVSVKKFLSMYEKGSDVVSINIYTPTSVVTKNGRGERPAKLIRSIYTLGKF